MSFKLRDLSADGAPRPRRPARTQRHGLRPTRRNTRDLPEVETLAMGTTHLGPNLNGERGRRGGSEPPPSPGHQASICGDATTPAVAAPRRLTAAPPAAAQARRGRHLAAGPDELQKPRVRTGAGCRKLMESSAGEETSGVVNAPAAQSRSRVLLVGVSGLSRGGVGVELRCCHGRARSEFSPAHAGATGLGGRC